MLKKILPIHKILSTKIEKRIFSMMFVLASVSSLVCAVPKKLVLGGEKGWGDVKSMEGLARVKGVGRFGYESLQLVTSTQEINDETDLLLTFDDASVRDSIGHYEVISCNLSRSNDAVRGRGAALSRGVEKGITLKGDKNSIFGSTGLVGSFKIEFWLCPSLAENGETVFSWRSSLNSSVYSKYQMITASFSSNHLEWKFNNIFTGYSDDEVILAGTSTTVPKKWSRHTVSFDQDTGALEYSVDGRTECIKFMTETGHENGTVCEPSLGVAAKIEICSQYSGKIDNFRIDRGLSAKSSDCYACVPGQTGNERFKVDGGYFVSKFIPVSHSAVLDSIKAEMKVPSQTDVKFYVRAGDDCYAWDDNFPEWKEVVPGEKIEGVKGLYFQIMGQLLPDGGGANSPKLSELVLSYTEQDDPLPPFMIHAEPGNGSVTLSWSNSVDDSAGGYNVYYGNRPGEYLGMVAVEGPSPVKVGNRTSVTLNGLKNGTIYYFAVSAYSKVDERICGELSKEVYARPSARLSTN